MAFVILSSRMPVLFPAKLRRTPIPGALAELPVPSFTRTDHPIWRGTYDRLEIRSCPTLRGPGRMPHLPERPSACLSEPRCPEHAPPGAGSQRGMYVSSSPPSSRIPAAADDRPPPPGYPAACRLGLPAARLCREYLATLRQSSTGYSSTPGAAGKIRDLRPGRFMVLESGVWDSSTHHTRLARPRGAAGSKVWRGRW
jgi:hypothetical protein